MLHPMTALRLWVLLSVAALPRRWAFIEPSENSRADILLGLVPKGECPGVETPVIPGGPDDSTPMMLWKGLGQIVWRRVVECVGLGGYLNVGTGFPWSVEVSFQAPAEGQLKEKASTLGMYNACVETQEPLSLLLDALRISVPIFAWVILGAALSRVGVLRGRFINVVSRFSFNIALPIVLLVGASGVDYTTLGGASYLYAAIISSLLVFG